VQQDQGRGAAEDVIVVAVPVELKSVVGPIDALIAMAGAKIRAARGTHAVDYAQTEKEVEACLAAIERATHVGLLAALDVDVPRVEIGGKTFRRVGRSPASYRTMAGDVKVKRTL
jgi:hypothetical protein